MASRRLCEGPIRCPEHVNCAQRAQWPCGHQTCLKCADKLIMWDLACPQCRQPHHRKYVKLTAKDVKELHKRGALPDLTPHPGFPQPNFTIGGSLNSSVASKLYGTSLDIAGGLKKPIHPTPVKSEPIPVVVPKQSVLPSQKQSVNPYAAALKLPATSSSKMAPSTATPSTTRPSTHKELEQLKCRLEASEKLQAALEKRVNTLQREKIELMRARDAALTEKEEALKRVKTAEEKCVVDELRLLRQLRTEEHKNKRLTRELDESEDKAQNLRQVLALYKEKQQDLQDHLNTLKRKRSDAFSSQVTSSQGASSTHFSSSLPPSSPPTSTVTDVENNDDKFEIVPPSSPLKPSKQERLDLTMLPHLPRNSPPKKRFKPATTGTLKDWMNANLHIGPKRSRRI